MKKEPEILSEEYVKWRSQSYKKLIMCFIILAFFFSTLSFLNFIFGGEIIIGILLIITSFICVCICAVYDVRQGVLKENTVIYNMLKKQDIEKESQKSLNSS